MANKALDISLHTAVLYTAGTRPLPVDNADLAPLNGTTGPHIRHIPADNQVRENLMHNELSVASFSVETAACYGATRQNLNMPSEDIRDPPAGEPDKLDQFKSEHRVRQNISMYTTNLSRLLLLCGDIESNPGPSDRDGDSLTMNQEIDGVSACKDLYF